MLDGYHYLLVNVYILCECMYMCMRVCVWRTVCEGVCVHRHTCACACACIHKNRNAKVVKLAQLHAHKLYVVIA